MAHDVVRKPMTRAPERVPRLRGVLHAAAFPLPAGAGAPLFNACTVAAYAAQYAAVFLVVSRSAG